MVWLPRGFQHGRNMGKALQMEILDQLADAVIEGKITEIEALTQEAIGRGIAPMDIINLGLLKGMTVVGKRFGASEMFIPEVLLSAKTMNTSVEMIKPLLLGDDLGKAGTVVIGTVKGDLHDVGKNIVIMLLETAGFEVIDLGIDIPQEEFAQAVREKKPDVLGMSAMLTTTMMECKKVIEFLEKENLRGNVKVMVGGAPLNQSFATQCGADGYAEDAVEAVELVKKLVAH